MNSITNFILALFFFSSLSFAQSNPVITLVGEYSGDRFGYFLNKAGDVNNDGYDDFLVAAPGYNDGQGRVYVFLGGTEINGEPDYVLTGEYSENEFGYSVSTAGDVNNDGYDDIIVGAVSYDSHRGKAYLYLGGTSMSEPALTFTGLEAGQKFARSVSTAGDVNGDGFDDVIIGCHYANTHEGRAFIFFGGTQMDGQPDIILSPHSQDFHFFGWSVATAGDVNNDGYADVVIGATKFDAYRGKAYVFFGGANMDDIPDMQMSGEEQFDNFGWMVNSAGDINGDGYDEVIIGSTYYNDSTGRAYIYYGGETPDSEADIILTGETDHNYLGRAVSCAGDVDADGYDDILTSAMRHNSYTGKAYIFKGSQYPDIYSDWEYFGEETRNYFGKSLSGIGDINADGYDDFIVGAWRNNSDKGKVYVFLGYPMTGVENSETFSTKKFMLAQNFPNPFNPNTKIRFYIPESASDKFIVIKVYDVLGREITTLAEGRFNNGWHDVNFNANGLTSGVYFYRMFSNGLAQTRKMILLE